MTIQMARKAVLHYKFAYFTINLDRYKINLLIFIFYNFLMLAMVKILNIFQGN